MFAYILVSAEFKRKVVPCLRAAVVLQQCCLSAAVVSQHCCLSAAVVSQHCCLSAAVVSQQCCLSAVVVLLLCEKKPRDQCELFFLAHSYVRLLKTSISFFKPVFLKKLFSNSLEILVFNERV